MRQENIWYHGSNKNFTQFDLNKSGQNFKINNLIGIYLTDEIDVAKQYGSIIYTVQVNSFNIRNPISSKTITISIDEFIKFIDSFGNKGKQLYKDLGYNEYNKEDKESAILDLFIWETDLEILSKIFEYIEVKPKLFLENLLNLGYTHCLIKDDKQINANTLLVFKQPQIISKIKL